MGSWVIRGQAKRNVPGAAGVGLDLCAELLYLVAQLLDLALVLANALLGLCHLLLLCIQLSLQLPHLQGAHTASALGSQASALLKPSHFPSSEKLQQRLKPSSAGPRLAGPWGLPLIPLRGMGQSLVAQGLGQPLESAPEEHSQASAPTSSPCPPASGSASCPP